MLYITLPEFYFNYKIINEFKSFSDTKPFLFKTPTTFSAASGNFPYCYWNGGYNNNLGPSIGYEGIIDNLKYFHVPIRFNCANIYLKKEDFSNVFANLILSLGENGSNTISFSNMELYEFLKEKYPYYEYIFSREADLIFPLAPEVINTILEENKFKLIELPDYYSNNWKLLDNIQNPSKVELIINSHCLKNCPKKLECKYDMHQSQYDFSNFNIHHHCFEKIPYHHKNNILISIDEIIENYLPKGFNHFSLAPIWNSFNNELLIFLVKYFIKEEYQTETYQFLLEKGGN